MAEGVHRLSSSADVDLVPLADGGEGTAEALLSATGGSFESAVVPGPLGEPTGASIALLADGTAVVEMAASSGLHLVDARRRDPLRASSRGTGELVRAALDRDPPPHRIVVGVGGSASTDGGTGAAAALGWRFLDRRGRELPEGGGALTELERIDATRLTRDVRGHGVTGICDVDSPLLGHDGAAQTFAPQKGATPEQVDVLERGLKVLDETIKRDLGVDVGSVPGAGAGGGMGAGLIAFFDAKLERGFEFIATATRLRSRMEGADLVLTGEGRLDLQSLRGKASFGVAKMARALGVPCMVVAGEIALDDPTIKAAGFRAAAGLVDIVGRESAFAATTASITKATEALLRGELRV